ncbi:MAG TPA: V4R domain-containing protein [Gemmatimonadaceae bacterium]|nr:V4R domain-containing protein [Gemmatimonadaceae bacterium]
MPYPTDLAAQQLIALPRASLSALRGALRRDAGAGYATYLQQAGYAGGETVFTAFREWLSSRGADAPEALPLDAFATQVGAFFGDTGWGRVDVSPMGSVVATIDCPEWAESDPDAQLEHPGCHFTTGLFADFFGRVANSALAVLEVECRSCGGSKCRFVAGSAEVMQHVYERMAAGSSYESAVGELS